MKIPAFILAALLSLCIAQAHAATTAAPATTPAATATAPATTTPATTTTPQQNRMKSCAAKYHQQNIPKAQYKTFMSQCLKNPTTAAATPAATSATTPATAPAKPVTTK